MCLIFFNPPNSDSQTVFTIYFGIIWPIIENIICIICFYQFYLFKQDLAIKVIIIIIIFSITLRTAVLQVQDKLVHKLLTLLQTMLLHPDRCRP